MSRCSKNAKPGDRKDGEENGNKMPTQQYNKPRNPTDSDADNFGNNNRLSRPPYGSENRHYNQNAPPNTFNGAYKNNNANSNNAPFRDRQMYNNDRRAPANRMDDRNDGRGVPLRSRGENLNQNFAQGFRRFPNRNQQDGRQGGHQHKQEEPEWFTEGPISQHDTIELKGFDEDEDKLGASKNSSNSNVPPHHSPPQQQQQQQSRNNAPPMKANHHAQQRDDFDLSELSNFDWQNVNAHPNVDKDTIESIENSSRFARWFNDQPPAQSSENQLERLFSNARPPPPNHLNANLMNSQQLQQLHLQQQQQQLHLQNDFMGNLMGRGNLAGNLAGNLGPVAGGNGLNSIKQQINNNSNLLHGYPIKQPEVEVLFNSPQKKTDQQLLNILQKARINVDNLMGQQREIGQDQRAPKGHVKSAEELEASLFGSPEVPSTAMGCPQQPAQHVTADLLRKLCLNSNQSDQANKPPQHLPQHQPPNQPLQQFMREENSAINPFVMNLLDAQKLKNASPVNRGKPNNYLPNMMFNNSGGGVGSSQEKVHNPFMPTSVIRKIAAKEKNVQMNRNVNANMNEIVNFETVTGNQVSERSILNRLGLGDSQPRAMNHQDNFIANLSQPNVMKQNFAITTADSWNNDPHHGNFNMHPQHLQQQQHPAMNQSMEGARAMHNNEELKNILMKAQTRKPNANLNNLANNQSKFLLSLESPIIYFLNF